MHYTDTGPAGAPAVVLMHGWGCTGSTVESIRRVAVDAGRRVLTVDFPGFGDSPEPPGVWGVEEYTALVEALLEQEGLRAPVLIGHSFGGRVAILLASRRKVQGVVLVDAAGIKPRRSLRYYYKVYTFKAAKLGLRLLLGPKGARERIDAMRRSRGSADYAQASPRMQAILSKVVNEDLTSRLRLILSPTLLIWGEDDTATPLRDARTMEHLIPDAGLVSFPGCGHYSFLDNPAAFASVLQSFLNALSPSR